MLLNILQCPVPHTQQGMIWAKMSVAPRLRKLILGGRLTEEIVIEVRFYLLTEIRQIKPNMR